MEPRNSSQVNIRPPEELRHLRKQALIGDDTSFQVHIFKKFVVHHHRWIIFVNLTSSFSVDTLEAQGDTVDEETFINNPFGFILPYVSNEFFRSFSTYQANKLTRLKRLSVSKAASICYWPQKFTLIYINSFWFTSIYFDLHQFALILCQFPYKIWQRSLQHDGNKKKSDKGRTTKKSRA